MGQGWQFIHAYMVSEGSKRRWSTQNVGEAPVEISNWRSKVKSVNIDEA